MPDAYNNFKGIAVPADAWERIFGRTCPEPGGCLSCPDSSHCRSLRVDFGITTAEQEADHPNRDNSAQDR